MSNPGDPIAIEPTAGRVLARVNGEVVADTRAALGLREASHPVVQYAPMADVHRDMLSRSDTHTYCPDKGQAGYYDVTAGGVTVADVIWTYETPHDAVAEIAGHVAFHPDKAEITVEPD